MVATAATATRPITHHTQAGVVLSPLPDAAVAAGVGFGAAAAVGVTVACWVCSVVCVVTWICVRVCVCVWGCVWGVVGGWTSVCVRVGADDSDGVDRRVVVGPADVTGAAVECPDSPDRLSDRVGLTGPELRHDARSTAATASPTSVASRPDRPSTSRSYGRGGRRGSP